MDYTALNQRTSSLIQKLGFSITLERDGVVVGKAYGVVTPSDTKANGGLTSVTPIQTDNKVMYVSAPARFVPQVHDFVIAKHGKWQIVAIEQYAPSTTTIAYRIEVQ